MDIQPFEQHEQALKFRALRNQVLSSNIANADTPNYKARDLDFATAMKNAQGGQVSMRRTSDLHQQSWSTNPMTHDVKYRVPVQPTLDGNTVETDVEQAAFAENAVHYRSTLAFLDGKIRTLRFALKGSD
jgi:flagellar basal-body rod protein FlgB